MRFWRIEMLKAEIREGSIGPSEYLRYLIATGAIVIVAPLIAPEPRNSWDIAIAAVELAFFVVGTIASYRASQGSNGRDFFGPYLAISWVLAIRLSAMLLAPAAIAYGLLEFFSGNEVPSHSTAIDFGAAIVWSAIFYARLVSHFRGMAAA